MGQYPELSRGPPPLLQALVAPALLQTFVARHYYMMDLVAPALSQKPIFATNLVAPGALWPCYKAEGFDQLPCVYIHIYIYMYAAEQKPSVTPIACKTTPPHSIDPGANPMTGKCEPKLKACA